MFSIQVLMTSMDGIVTKYLLQHFASMELCQAYFNSIQWHKFYFIWIHLIAQMNHWTPTIKCVGIGV
jgi:hypothetical protein